MVASNYCVNVFVQHSGIPFNDTFYTSSVPAFQLSETIKKDVIYFCVKQLQVVSCYITIYFTRHLDPPVYMTNLDAIFHGCNFLLLFFFLNFSSNTSKRWKQILWKKPFFSHKQFLVNILSYHKTFEVSSCKYLFSQNDEKQNLCIFVVKN